MTTEPERYRVIKTLSPSDRGAIELARRYGDALVCVRHRTDAKGKVRHTTVELVVDRTPIRPRPVRMVGIKVDAHERPLQAMLKAAGARWDPESRLWRLPRRVAGILNLRQRIVDE